MAAVDSELAETSSSSSKNWSYGLKSAPASPSKAQTPWCPPDEREDDAKAVAKLEGRDLEYVMRRPKIVIGRTSPRFMVDVSLGHSKYISRRHIEIRFEAPNFYLTCDGKNGIYVNDIHQRKGDPEMLLPNLCTLRFPSTNIRILFKSLNDDNSLDNNNISPINVESATPTMMLPPLQINIPDREYVVASSFTVNSPFSSPNGTISATNSCPTSPRSSHLMHRNLFLPEDLQIAAVCTSHSKAITPPSPSVSNVFSKTERSSGKLPISTSLTITPIRNAFSNAIPAAMAPFPKEEPSENGTVASSTMTTINDKPPYSYAQLIVQAVASVPEKQLTLSGIYSYIAKHYPYYRTGDKGWQNSIRHNLSLNRYFLKVARNQEEPGKGCFWRIDPASEAKLTEQAYRRRRQRGVQRFKSVGFSDFSTRSAPVSPTQNNAVIDAYSSENYGNLQEEPLNYANVEFMSAPASPGNDGFLTTPSPPPANTSLMQPPLMRPPASFTFGSYASKSF